ncbi:glycoside hydrolase family 92 protein [Amylostereum chailletii]|nr:glycoside hydrolase family 92 protein [Amylostereum chailletii]
MRTCPFVKVFSAAALGPVSLLFAPSVYAQSSADLASFVNLFIGTTNGGHVFPGATLPHGYDADPTYHVTGFSQLHDDGTGGSVPLSNFKIFPSANCTSFEACNVSLLSRKILRNILPDGTPDDAGVPGYFSSNLSSGVRVELTATRRTSIQRHTFPPNAEGTLPRINVDITNDGQSSSEDPTILIDPVTGRVKGGANFQASFGPGRYNANISPVEYGAWSLSGPARNTTNATGVLSNPFADLGALLSFEPAGTGQSTTVLVRSGVSLISADQACSNAEEDIPSFDFDAVARSAREEWNELLGRVQVTVEDGQEDTRELLYSSLYRSHISPADYSGENPLWKSDEPYYDSFYCNWDTYRTLYPLMAMHDPERFAQIVRAMIDIQKNEGWLPECRGATQLQFVQGGSNGDPIVSEFFVKYSDRAASLGISGEDLYAALVADAETQYSNVDLNGRIAFAWMNFKYVPQDYNNGSVLAPPREVSRALEYAFDDFTISQVAKLLGKTDDAELYAGRAANFVFSWNPNVTMPGGPDSVVGMMQPRLRNGTFAYTDPRHCSINDPTHSTCFLDSTIHDGFYEGSPILYSQYVPHDTAKLIELQGGPESFIERLDFIIDNGYFDVTDEPGQQIPFMYHYANRPGLSTQRARQTIAQFFNTTVAGLPGNDDSGAMGSYAFFYLAGLYPLPATRQILLSSPHFPSVTFSNPLLGTNTTIRVKNFAGNPPSGTGQVFVKSVTIDGQPWHSTCFLEWDVFERGATVELELTDDITVTCGSSDDALPPSLSTGGYY